MVAFGEVAADFRALRPVLPARDFSLSGAFYEALGFVMRPLGDQLAEARKGSHAFLLQDRYVVDWAENCVMHALVDDLDAQWALIERAHLVGRFGVKSPVAPAIQPWGLRVAFVYDPSGVLWHFAEMPATAGDAS